MEHLCRLLYLFQFTRQLLDLYFLWLYCVVYTLLLQNCCESVIVVLELEHCACAFGPIFGGKFKQIARAWNVKSEKQQNKMEACVCGPLSPSPTSSKRSLSNFSLLYLLFIILCQLSEVFSAQLSADKSLVFGPGVHPERVGLPVNYFYIQAVDTKGRK
jgi:hypothetical protein